MENYIAWWGAGLSTLLALIKLFELWNGRFRIETGYSFTGHPDIGNDIFIRNLTSNRVILSYWELFYRSHYWPLVKDSQIDSSEDICEILIEPNSSKTLNFSGANSFSWGHKAMNKRRIYLRLNIAGRRAITKKIYG